MGSTQAVMQASVMPHLAYHQQACCNRYNVEPHTLTPSPAPNDKVWIWMPTQTNASTRETVQTSRSLLETPTSQSSPPIESARSASSSNSWATNEHPCNSIRTSTSQGTDVVTHLQESNGRITPPNASTLVVAPPVTPVINRKRKAPSKACLERAKVQATPSKNVVASQEVGLSQEAKPAQPAEPALTQPPIRLSHVYHPEKATSKRGTAGTERCYRCGYCGFNKIARSSSSDGQVRIRCSCGGMKQDGKNRMHAHWHYTEVDPILIQQQTYVKPDPTTKPATKQGAPSKESPASIFAAVKQPVPPTFSSTPFDFLPQSPGQQLLEPLEVPCNDNTQDDGTAFQRETSTLSLESPLEPSFEVNDVKQKSKPKSKSKPSKTKIPQDTVEREELQILQEKTLMQPGSCQLLCHASDEMDFLGDSLIGHDTMYNTTCQDDTPCTGDLDSFFAF